MSLAPDHSLSIKENPWLLSSLVIQFKALSLVMHAVLLFLSHDAIRVYHWAPASYCRINIVRISLKIAKIKGLGGGGAIPFLNNCRASQFIKG
jgi:hypothetical protein